MLLSYLEYKSITYDNELIDRPEVKLIEIPNKFQSTTEFEQGSNIHNIRELDAKLIINTLASK